MLGRLAVFLAHEMGLSKIAMHSGPGAGEGRVHLAQRGVQIRYGQLVSR